MKFLYPGHNYLGPGNPLENGPTVDTADAIAKVHDYEYHNATTQEDIFESDQRAVSQFANDFFHHPNFPSLAGALGLSLKTGIEKNLTGVLYPTGMSYHFGRINANKKREREALERRVAPEVVDPEGGEKTPDHPVPNIKGWHPPSKDPQDTATPAKVSKLDLDKPGPSIPSYVMQSQLDTMDAGPSTVAPTASTSSMSGNANTAGGMRGTVSLPIGSKNVPAKYIRTFTKQYHFRIFNNLVQRRNQTISNVVWNDIIPNYHEIPVQLLGFYLSPNEINRLRGKTQVKVLSAGCKVANKTAILTFETNASGTQIGNNNIGVTLCQLDPNIEMARSGGLVKNSTAVMQQVCWGRDVNSYTASVTPTTDLPGLSAQYVIRNFDNRFYYRTVRANSGRTHDFREEAKPMQFFNYNRWVIQRRNASIEEGPFCEWSYQPRNGIIFGTHKGLMPCGNINSNNTTYNIDKQQNYLNRLQTVALSSGLVQQPGVANVGGSVVVPGTVVNDIFQNAATNDLITIDDHYVNCQSSNEIPVLSIGIEPQVAINQASDAVSAVPCHVDLIVDASIVIEITEGIDYDDSNNTDMLEYNYKYPNFRTYRYNEQIPTLMVQTIGAENAVETEHNFNTDTSTITVPTTWSWPTIPTTSSTTKEPTSTYVDADLEKRKRVFKAYVEAGEKLAKEQEEEPLVPDDWPKNKKKRQADDNLE